MNKKKGQGKESQQMIEIDVKKKKLDIIGRINKLY